MDCLEILSKRRSSKSFRRKHIPPSVLFQIIDAALSVPSAGGLQAYSIILVRDLNKKHQLALASYRQMWLELADIVLVIAANIEEYKSYFGDEGERYAIIDASMLADSILAAAWFKGISGGIVYYMEKDKVKDIVKIPDGWDPVLMLGLGYSISAEAAPTRKGVAEVLFFEEFGERSVEKGFRDYLSSLFK